MARPHSKKKSQQLINEKDIYNAIKIKLNDKYNKKILNTDIVKDIFRAYAEIVLTATGKDCRINLPYLGQFFSSDEKGWQGGFVNCRTNFCDETTEKREYYPPKPDHKLIRFEIRKSVRDAFKKVTEIPLNYTQQELQELKKQAEIKEEERIKKKNG